MFERNTDTTWMRLAWQRVSGQTASMWELQASQGQKRSAGSMLKAARQGLGCLCLNASMQKAIVSPHFVVFTGKSVQQQWFPQNDEELQEYVSWNFTATENGWTCNDIGY